MKILFMLPARSGSVGVPDKNIRMLGGHPLMWYAINAVRNSSAYQSSCQSSDKFSYNTSPSHNKSHKSEGSLILVNTDSTKYCDVAMECGADQAMLRDKSLATSESKISDTIKVVMEKFEPYDLFCLVQITSPFTTSDDVDRLIGAFDDKTVQSAVAVTEAEICPLWCNTLPADLSAINLINKEIRKKNRQELPKYYRLTGAIRAARWNDFIEHDYDFLEGNSKAVIMEQSHSLDIDTMTDFQYAKFLIEGTGRN